MNNLSRRCRRKLVSCVLAVPLAAWWAVAVQAQGTSELAATYGRGVHAFFAGQSGAAEELFSDVINAGSTDPRVYYFRAMARMNCGRQYEAEQDMKVGAAYEARDPGNRYSVSKALERVQGPDRRTLEEYRQQARLDRVQQRQQMSRKRYETLEERGPEVLRREMPVPLEDLVEPSLTLPDTVRPSQPAPAPAVRQPVVPPNDPRPTPPVPPSDPAEADPFGAESLDEPAVPVERAEPTPPPVEATPPQDDPFGGSAPAEESEESETPVPPQDPADAGEEEDPFASAPSGANDAAIVTAASSELEEDDRVESGQMVGIVGRIAASALPWRGVELPSLGPFGSPEGLSAGEPTEIALGPVEEDSAVSPTTADEPIEAEAEDVFGESETSADVKPADELFGEEAAESAEAPAAAESEPATSEDPFEF